VAVITGAAGGLGTALTAEFAKAGWRVTATARDIANVNGGTNVFPCELDVTRSGSVEGCLEATLQQFGRIDALIHNAGVTGDALCVEMSEEEWTRVLDVNLRGAFLCARAAARVMAKQRGGHIINISSFAGRAGARGQANYAAAKAGLIGLTQSIAKELGSRNVRANAILPGVLPTKMTASLPPERMEAFAKANALGRINSVDEVARFIVFLAGTQNISGQVFQLDSRIAPWT
jgi:3-oxoacyl-[acyl-carrier protein] reductase